MVCAVLTKECARTLDVYEREKRYKKKGTTEKCVKEDEGSKWKRRLAAETWQTSFRATQHKKRNSNNKKRTEKM